MLALVAGYHRLPGDSQMDQDRRRAGGGLRSAIPIQFLIIIATLDEDQGFFI